LAVNGQLAEAGGSLVDSSAGELPAFFRELRISKRELIYKGMISGDN
jgi:hypothetical protein